LLAYNNDFILLLFYSSPAHPPSIIRGAYALIAYQFVAVHRAARYQITLQIFLTLYAGKEGCHLANTSRLTAWQGKAF